MRLLLFLSLSQLRFVLAFHVPELAGWKEDSYIDCIFCVDYDSYRRLNFNGCLKGKSTTCRGNVCYMRQHKSSQFFLFTSGCLNLTHAEYEDIAKEQKSVERQFGGSGTETLLCEVAEKTNTCMCRTVQGEDGSSCNNMTIPAQFSEFHTSSLFEGLRFHELLQFRYYMPHTPIFHSVDLRVLDDQLLQTVRGFQLGLPSSSSSFSLLIIIATAWFL